MLKDGKVRAIGVSNFMVEHLTNLLDEAEVVPAVNQIELHPYFQQPEVQAFNVFDFELTTDEVAAIDGLETGKRGGPEPDAITLESFGREIPEA